VLFHEVLKAGTPPRPRLQLIFARHVLRRGDQSAASWHKTGKNPTRCSTHDQIANVFSRRPNQDTAAKFRAVRNQAFATWAEVTGVAIAA